MERWKRNLYTLWFTQILSLAGFSFFNPFVPYFLQDIGVTDPQRLSLWVGLISSVPSLVMAAVSPLWGYLADRIGKKVMILRAMIGGSILIGLMGVARNVQTVFILRCLVGIVAGSVPATQTLVASGTPVKRLSYALGFLASSTYMGIVVGPLLGGISAELLGYRRSFLIGAFIMAAGAALVLILIREPESERLEEHHAAQSFSWKNLLAQPFVMVFVALILTRFSQMIPRPFIPLYVQELLGRLEGAASTTGFISAGAGAVMTISTLTLVRLGDRFDKTALTAVFLGACGLAAFPLYFVPKLWAFVVFHLATTYFLAAVEPTLQGLLGSVTPQKNRGVVFGVYTSISHIGWFLSPLAGSAVSIAFELRAVFLLYAASFIGSFAVMLGFQLWRKRRISGWESRPTDP